MRKIHRRNFLKAAGILSAAVAGSLMTACGGSDAGTQAAASNLTPYNELTVGTDHTDLTATIKVINHRTDLIQDGTFDGYVAEFQKLYPNITIEYERRHRGRLERSLEPRRRALRPRGLIGRHPVRTVAGRDAWPALHLL